MKNKKISNDVKNIIEMSDRWGIDLAYGLAPNPFGFTFINFGDAPKLVIKKFSKLLEALSSEEENELRKEYF